MQRRQNESIIHESQGRMDHRVHLHQEAQRLMDLRRTKRNGCRMGGCDGPPHKKEEMARANFWEDIPKIE